MSGKNILIIAQNTYKEMIRDRILYILIFFSIGLLVLSMLLSQLSTFENLRLTLDFGFTGISFSMVIMTLFLGGTLVYREIDKKTVLFIMSYPLSRSEFLLGKFIGFVFILLTLLIGLSLSLFLLVCVSGWTPHISFLIAVYGIFLEMSILLGITFLLGTLLRPVLVIACGIGFFLIGHGLNSFSEIVIRGQNQLLKELAFVLKKIWPNLENMNWINYVSYSELVPLKVVLLSSLYSLGWVLFFVTISVYLFRKKDFI